MSKPKYGYQVWHEETMIDNGEGRASTLERFAEIVKAEIERDLEGTVYYENYEIDELGWTVWDLETEHYLEYQGSKLVDQG